MLLYGPIEIIAVSYFRPNDFSLCIRSILENTLVPYNLTIIDNSSGGIQKQLHEFAKIPNVKIIENHRNIGKGASFKLWYNTITKNSSTKYIVSIDADIIVPKEWLSTLIRSTNEIDKPLGAIAPVLMHTAEDSFESQISNKSLTMHGRNKGFNNMQKVSKHTYYNIYTAGSLFLIDREFYESIGGYPGNCLYGHDDGYICSKSQELHRFVGFTTTVACIHSRTDETKEYRRWKRNNISKVNHHSGYWD